MPFEAQMSLGVQLQQMAQFPFTSNVYQFCVGISGFNLAYETLNTTDTNWVDNIGIHLHAWAAGNTVYVYCFANMRDTAGHFLDDLNSHVDITCIAETGTSDGNVVLANSYGIPSGQVSAPIAAPSSPYSSIVPIVSGFDLTFGSVAEVQRIGTSIGAQLNSDSSASLAPASYIFDASSGSASMASVDGGLIIANTSETNIAAAFSGPITQYNKSESLTFPSNFSADSVVIFLQAFHLAYSWTDNDGGYFENHSIQSLGITGNTTYSPNQPTVNMNLTMTDGSNNLDQNTSSASFVVIGIGSTTTG